MFRWIASDAGMIKPTQPTSYERASSAKGYRSGCQIFRDIFRLPFGVDREQILEDGGVA